MIVLITINLNPIFLVVIPKQMDTNQRKGYFYIDSHDDHHSLLNLVARSKVRSALFGIP